MKRRVRAVIRTDLRVAARDGEQLLLILGIPLLFLAFFSLTTFLDYDDPVAHLTPAMIGLGLVGAAFTRTAIGIGFDRSFGALARYAVTPLRVSEFLTAKGLATGAVALVQIILISVLGVALGWRPSVSWDAIGVVVLGAIGLFAAGVVLASITEGLRCLAVANLCFVIILLICGAVVPLDDLPSWLSGAAKLLGPTAVVSGLGGATDGSGVPGWVWVNLTAWAAVGSALALRLFRWR